MNEEEKNKVESVPQEEPIPAVPETGSAENNAQLEELARRVVQEERARWEAENRQRRRKKRKWILLGVGIALLILAAALALLLFGSQDDPIIVNQDTIPMLSPIDEQAAARIDAMEGYAPEDTWVFYLYWVGSDLEAGNTNQLSDIVNHTIAEEVDAIRWETQQREHTQLLQLSEEIAGQGLELPDYLFAPQQDLRGVTSSDADERYIQGDASADLWEYMSVPLPENVQFVIQTGGSPAWADPNVNPNRIQRFLLDSQGMREIYNGPICNMGHPDTLADFLTFCADTYPADHQVVILWDHGGGDSGFGVDEIYSDRLTLPQLREAFSAAFPPNREDPPLEMIYFACCLMSNAETLNYMDGFSKYMVAAEEVTFTVPTACSGWLEQFVQNTGINGAQLGKLIVDSYMNAVLQLAAEHSYILPTTMNLLDMRHAGDIYDAYGDFAQAALRAQIQDPGMISEVAYSAAPSVFLANSSYSYYNLIDLTLFMENAAASFPAEANAVIDAVEDVMMYKRATEYLKDAGGISIYYPYHLETTDSITKCLEYIDSVSDNEDINAMYYYKLTGCMNETYQQHCVDSGYGAAQTLRYDELYRLRNAQVELEENGSMALSLTQTECLLLQDAVYELMRVDGDTLVYLGEDRFVDITSGQLHTDFPATWVSIDGVPFALEIINTDEENIQYRTMVGYRSDYVYLVLNYHYDTQRMTVLGVRDIEYTAATLDRGVTPLREGEELSPVYYTSDLYGGDLSLVSGIASADYTGSSVISEATLEDGTYIARIKLEDMRNDCYYTQPIRLTVENGQVTQAVAETEYHPAAYR